MPSKTYAIKFIQEGIVSLFSLFKCGARICHIEDRAFVIQDKSQGCKHEFLIEFVLGTNCHQKHEFRFDVARGLAAADTRLACNCCGFASFKKETDMIHRMLSVT